jgi:hypothetical protein
MADRVDMALKEWEVVCDALASGEQSILLRKGGIQEGPGGFSLSHDRFALLPTRLHQNFEMLKPAYRDRVRPGESEPASFRLTHAAEIESVEVVPDRAMLDALDDQHIWAEPYLEMRWNYRPERPLYLARLRVTPLARAFDLPNTFEVAGCRSWVPLPEPLTIAE